MIEKLVADLLFKYLGCHYRGDIHGVFLEAVGKCKPFRIGATITSEINSAFHCLNATRISSWLYQWNSTYGTVEMFNNINDHSLNLTHCSPRIERATGVSIQKCHRVVYCSKSPRKDRTVCLEDGYFKKRVNLTQTEQNTEHYLSAKGPRSLCLVTFV